MILDTAKALVSTGLASKGYNFVNIDDCWQIARDPVTHEIIADPATFPSGIPKLAD
jgi:alpha-galactosidase